MIMVPYGQVEKTGVALSGAASVAVKEFARGLVAEHFLGPASY